MTLELVSEEVPSAHLCTLYPFNALRNHALLLVRTEVRDCCNGFLLHTLLLCLLLAPYMLETQYTLLLTKYACNIQLQHSCCGMCACKHAFKHRCIVPAQLHEDRYWYTAVAVIWLDSGNMHDS